MSNLGVLVASVVFRARRRKHSSDRTVHLTSWSARWARSSQGEVLCKIASTWDPKVALLILESNPHIEKKHLRLLAAIEDGRVRAALCSHPECPNSLLRDSVRYGGENVRVAVAQRMDLPDDVQRALVMDRSPLVRAAVAGNPCVPEELRILAALR